MTPEEMIAKIEAQAAEIRELKDGNEQLARRYMELDHKYRKETGRL